MATGQNKEFQGAANRHSTVGFRRVEFIAALRLSMITLLFLHISIKTGHDYRQYLKRDTSTLAVQPLKISPDHFQIQRSGTLAPAGNHIGSAFPFSTVRGSFAQINPDFNPQVDGRGYIAMASLKPGEINAPLIEKKLAVEFQKSPSKISEEASGNKTRSGESEKVRLPEVTDDRTEPAFSDEYQYTADTSLDKHTSNTRFNVVLSAYYEHDLRNRFDLANMADLQIYNPGPPEESVEALEIAPENKRIDEVNKFGMLLGANIGRHWEISSGIEYLEVSGSQIFAFDVEQKITTSVTRNIPIPGPAGSPPEYMKVEEEIVEIDEIRDTVTARFTYQALILPFQVRFHYPLSKKWEVYGALRAGIHLTRRNSTDYESSKLDLNRTNRTVVSSTPEYWSAGAGAGVGYNLTRGWQLQAEPVFNYMSSFGSQQSFIRTDAQTWGLRFTAAYAF